MKGLASFGRTLAFAAVAAAAAPLATGLLSPAMGGAAALAVYGIALSSVYVAGLAQRPLGGLAAAGMLSLAGFALLGLGGTLYSLALLCALVIGVLRSGLLRRDARAGASFARAFGIEALLIGGGLVLGAWLGRGAFFPVSFAIWGFFLVQAGFFLIGGPAARAARDTEPVEVDAFERATRRAAEMLDDVSAI